MKLLEVFRYELEHQLHKPSTWAYAVLLFGFALANAVEVPPINAEPARAGIDPYRKLIDRYGRDNVVTPIAAGTGPRPGGP